MTDDEYWTDKIKMTAIPREENNDKCKCGEDKFYFTRENNTIKCVKCGVTRRFL